MNAKELHAIYGPLWEKVPETKPIGLGWHNWSVEPRFTLDLKHKHSVTLGDGGLSDAPTSIAADLCAMSALRWLIQTDPREGICHGHTRIKQHIHEDVEDAGSFSVGVESRGGICYAITNGPTLHHAIVAACLAVAESKR